MAREDRRVVELVAWWGADQRVVGSGYVVAPGLVLTATHVAAPTGRRVERVQGRPLGTSYFVDVGPVWRSSQSDMALLAMVAGTELPP